MLRPGVVASEDGPQAVLVEGGVARLCTGCAIVREEGSEHGILHGGAWGRVDREGRIVVPVEYTRQELPPPP